MSIDISKLDSEASKIGSLGSSLILNRVIERRASSQPAENVKISEPFLSNPLTYATPSSEGKAYSSDSRRFLARAGHNSNDSIKLEIPPLSKKSSVQSSPNIKSEESSPHSTSSINRLNESFINSDVDGGHIGTNYDSQQGSYNSLNATDRPDSDLDMKYKSSKSNKPKNSKSTRASKSPISSSGSNNNPKPESNTSLPHTDSSGNINSTPFPLGSLSLSPTSTPPPVSIRRTPSEKSNTSARSSVANSRRSSYQLSPFIPKALSSPLLNPKQDVDHVNHTEYSPPFPVALRPPVFDLDHPNYRYPIITENLEVKMSSSTKLLKKISNATRTFTFLFGIMAIIYVLCGFISDHYITSKLIPLYSGESDPSPWLRVNNDLIRKLEF